MKNIVQMKSGLDPLKARRLRMCGAAILTVTLTCGLGMAQADGLSLGGKNGVSAGVSVGGGGISANVGLGGAKGVNAGVNVGSATGVANNTTSGVGTGAAPGVQVDVGVGPLVRKAKPKTVAGNAAKPSKPLAIIGPKSVVGVDTTVAGLDVVADVLEYNGNILDVCVGSCRNGTSGGGGGGGGGGGTDPTDPGDGNGGGGGGVVVIDPVTPVPPVPVLTPVSGTVPVKLDGLGSSGPCGEGAGNATEVTMTGMQSSVNTDPSFVRSTSDLNLPMQGVELRCSAGGNAQVYNGYSVIDMNGKKIGVVHDTFLTGDLKIRRIQFQGLDQRCFGLSDGKYTVKGAALTVDVPASFVYQ